MTGEPVFRAVEFAAKAHAGQFRKGTRIPYIAHPLGAAVSLIRLGAPEDAVVAALLHDTLEDTPVTLDEVRREFGDGVAGLVAGASEPDKADTWENRKRHTVESLKTAPLKLLLVSAADKLDNIRAIREDLEREGEAVWSRFKRSRMHQASYYRSLAEVFRSRAEGGPLSTLALQFAAEVAKVFPE